MKDVQCMGRLLASATHDMRNVLAVIRESAGLAADMIALAAEKGGLEHGDRLAAAMREIQQQVIHGAELAEGMEYLAQAGVREDDAEAAPCDLARVTRLFCLMAARRARAVQMSMNWVDGDEPVWTEASVMDVWRSLLQLFDLCASVGGKVDLRLAAGVVRKQEGIIVEVTGGGNRDLVLSAMTGSPLLSDPLKPGWRARLTPWRDTGQRFFLSVRDDQD